jgi:hypothetical protein
MKSQDHILEYIAVSFGKASDQYLMTEMMPKSHHVFNYEFNPRVITTFTIAKNLRETLLAYYQILANIN